MKKIFTLFIVTAIILASCSSGQVVRLTPVGHEIFWDRGSEVATIKDEFVDLYITYDEMENNDFVFYVCVHNNSSYPILISPDNFYYEKPGPDERSAAGPNVVAVTARNPENKLLELDRRLKEKKDEYDRKQAIDLTFTIIGTIIGVAAEAADDDDDDDDGYNATDVIVDNVGGYVTRSQIRSAEFENTMQGLKGLKDYYKNILMRKTTLDPDSTLTGLVLFPSELRYSFLDIILPINGTFYKFHYNVEVQ